MNSSIDEIADFLLSTGCFKKMKARGFAEVLVTKHQIDTLFLLSSVSKSGALSDILKEIGNISESAIEIVQSKAFQL